MLLLLGLVEELLVSNVDDEEQVSDNIDIVINNKHTIETEREREREIFVGFMSLYIYIYI